METLIIEKENILKAFNEGSEEQRLFIKKLFPDLLTNIMDRVKTFEDACAVNGSDPLDKKFTTGDINTIAFEKLKEIRKALLEGKTISFADPNQNKWWPWFNYSGSGFRFHDSHFDFSNTDAPSRLCLDSREKSDYFGQQFIELFNQYLN